MENGVRQDEHPGTVGALIDWCAGELDAGGVYCGHGTASTIDESASLVYHVAGLEHDALNHNVRAAHYALPIDAKQFEQVHELLRRRIDRRIPTPYLLNEAWFAGLKFYVDERVLIPRSPFAELIVARFEPWLGHAPVRRILEIGTGSACIAIACATAFPDSTVVATDVSDAALEVAAINVARHGFNDRITLLQADVFDGVSGYFDLIVSNPPYVLEAEMESLPAEYLHEPSIALASGSDGLASARRILQDAAGHLESGGMLAVEVGAGKSLHQHANRSTPAVDSLLCGQAPNVQDTEQDFRPQKSQPWQQIRKHLTCGGVTRRRRKRNLRNCVGSIDRST